DMLLQHLFRRKKLYRDPARVTGRNLDLATKRMLVPFLQGHVTHYEQPGVASDGAIPEVPGRKNPRFDFAEIQSRNHGDVETHRTANAPDDTYQLPSWPLPAADTHRKEVDEFCFVRA